MEEGKPNPIENPSNVATTKALEGIAVSTNNKSTEETVPRTIQNFSSVLRGILTVAPRKAEAIAPT